MVTRSAHPERREHPWPEYDPQPLLNDAYWVFRSASALQRADVLERVGPDGRVTGFRDDFAEQADGLWSDYLERTKAGKRDEPFTLRLAAAYLVARGVDVRVLEAVHGRAKDCGVYVDLLLLGLQAGMSEMELVEAMTTRVWPDQAGLAALAMLRCGVSLMRSEYPS